MNIYSIEENEAFKECSLLRFETPDEKWLDFVSANRQGNYQGKHYDLIMELWPMMMYTVRLPYI